MHVETAVEGAKGFEQQQLWLGASRGVLRGTFRVGWRGAASPPLGWNASAEALASALGALGAGPVRVARELGLEAAKRAEERAGATEGVGARTQVTAGGAWDGADGGVRFVVVFEGPPARFGPNRKFPLLTVDAGGLHSTNHSALVVANTSVLVAGEVPALDSALKGSAVLAVSASVEVGGDGTLALDDGGGGGGVRPRGGDFLAHPPRAGAGRGLPRAR